MQKEISPQAAALIYLSPSLSLFLRDFVFSSTREENNSQEWLDFFFATLAENFSSLHITKISGLESYCQKYNIKEWEHDSEISLFNRIWKSESTIDHIALFEGIFPLLDITAMRELYSIHCRYRAEFTLGENLPRGLAPFFFSRDFLQTFHDIHNSGEKDLNSFHHIAAYAQKNVQKFHTEIHFFEPDLRPYRLHFLLDQPRSYNLISFFREQIKLLPQFSCLQAIEKTLQTHPQILASMPAYLEIELTRECSYACTFCPRAFVKFSSLFIDAKLLISRLQEFAQNSFSDTALAFGGMGEPLQHPQAKEILLQAIRIKEFSFLLIETNGLHLSLLTELPLTQHDLKKLHVVININSAQANTYANLHGCAASDLDTVIQNISILANIYKENNLIPADYIWLQALKLEENEQEIDGVFDLSDKLQVSFLLQKYNRFETMPEKRLSDMTPLQRSFCWHLARDLYIRSDSTVAFCKQDIEATCANDSLQEKSLQEIFATRTKYFVDNFNRDYSFCKCQNCDEYYTFNN